MHENMRNMYVTFFFFRIFLSAHFSSYFASALITVHLTPREKPMKTEALKRRHGNEDRFTAHGSRMDKQEEGRAKLRSCP